MTNDMTNAMQRFIRDLRTKVNIADVCADAAAELAYDLANSTDDDDTSDEENEAQS